MKFKKKNKVIVISIRNPIVKVCSILVTENPKFDFWPTDATSSSLQRAYNLASVFNRGTSFCVSIMFPVIFNLPFMNATWGLILPNAMSTRSESVTESVVSGLTPSAGLPS